MQEIGLLSKEEGKCVIIEAVSFYRFQCKSERTFLPISLPEFDVEFFSYGVIQPRCDTAYRLVSVCGSVFTSILENTLTCQIVGNVSPMTSILGRFIYQAGACVCVGKCLWQQKAQPDARWGLWLGEKRDTLLGEKPNKINLVPGRD